MLLIQHGMVYTMESEHPRKADILIKDGKIAEIAENIQPIKEMELLDAAGKNVFPGFIDAHSHLGISEEKTSDYLPVRGRLTIKTNQTYQKFLKGLENFFPKSFPSKNPIREEWGFISLRDLS